MLTNTAEALPTDSLSAVNWAAVPPELCSTLAEEFAELFRAHLPPELAEAVDAYAMTRHPHDLASMADFREWCDRYHAAQVFFAGQPISR